MPKKDDNLKQAGQYDKIIRENLEITLPVIIRDVLGLDITESEELPDDIQHTKERKPDSLKRVTDAEGETYILHVEFQVNDEAEMVYRMAEYSIMLMRRYKLPVKQYLIFLKDIIPAMPVMIDTANHKYSFSLIRIADANYRLFMKADNPEVKMLAILANFGKEENYDAVKSIVDGIKIFTKSDFAESRYFKQLRIFTQLRKNLEQELEKAMISVSEFFKEENDFLYKRGEEKKSQVVVEKLIVKLGLSDEQAADIVGVSPEYVAKIRASLKKK
jgi:hypothetical protein